MLILMIQWPFIHFQKKDFYPSLIDAFQEYRYEYFVSNIDIIRSGYVADTGV